MAESPAAVNLGILLRSRVFQAAPTTELERLAPRCVTERYHRGAQIIRRGAPGDTLVVVGRGRVKGSVFAPDAIGEFIIGMFSPGDVFGEVSVFCGDSRGLSAVAVTETEALFVPRAELMALLERRPAVAVRLMETICEKLHAALDLSLSLRFLDLPSRFYQRLLYLGNLDSKRDGDGVRIQHGLSQRELADSIGVSREALNKLVGEWKRAGLLEYGRGYVVVRDPAALAMRLPASIRHESMLGSAQIRASDDDR
jgi:CRP/FNR family transcriptional regulator, cyclic AMP receptor protein